MTFRLMMIVAGPKRPIVCNIAGCLTEEDAKAKAKRLYDVIKFKSVELVK